MTYTIDAEIRYTQDMGESQIAGFSEIEHTADWELEVWAPTLPALLEQAARGMYELAGIELNETMREMRKIKLHFVDVESLLVSFLSKLLYFGETQEIGFDSFLLVIKDDKLKAVLYGASIAKQTKEIKAVTYHNLKVVQTTEGFRTRIVFDV